VSAAVRIAMWSGPRNLSTALMRAFEARGDAAVVDEPFYAAYLAATGLEHPLRAEVLASQPQDPQVVIGHLLGPVPGAAPLFYQKHMTHHMLPGIDRSWLAGVRSAFLLRAPREVLASYVKSRAHVDLADIGIVQQHELFDRECQRLGAAPPVVDSRDLLEDPAAVLAMLCAALRIDYTPAMLRWPAGRRATDGAWAPAWYAAVERSTGFEAPRPAASDALTPALQRLCDAADPYYARMARHKLGGGRIGGGPGP
jgi:hypothetical protein